MDINVNCFYDYDLEVWVNLPLDLEMLQTSIGRLIDSVQKGLKQLVDRRDILMMLRTCNYNKNKCIQTIHGLLGDKKGELLDILLFLRRVRGHNMWRLLFPGTYSHTWVFLRVRVVLIVVFIPGFGMFMI